MIQLTFSMKFQNQLRRTRPDVYSYVERTIAQCVTASGGKVKQEYHCMMAFFNEQTIGFWLDLLTIIETIKRTLDVARRDLYGYICVISKCFDDDQIQLLLHTLPSVQVNSGIWCTLSVRDSLDQLLFFTPPYRSKISDMLPDTFVQVDSTLQQDEYSENPFHNEIEKILSMNNGKNIVLVGKEFLGKRDALQCYVKRINSGFLPLTIRFGTWGLGLCYFVDALSPQIKKTFIDSGVQLDEELIKLHEMLFNERLRDECSAFSIEKGKQLCRILCTSYVRAAKNTKCTPIIILENIEKASDNATEIFIEVYNELLKNNDALIYATSTTREIPDDLKKIFSSLLNCTEETAAERETNNSSLMSAAREYQLNHLSNSGNLQLNKGLWEIAYAFKLFGQYFPSYLFLELFEEEGKSALSIKRSLELLKKNNIIKSIDNPLPKNFGNENYIADIIAERADFVRNMVKNRLLAWVSSGRLKPCFNLLETLYTLKYTPTALLVLESIRQDIINGTYRAIENAINNGTFDQICGQERAAPMFYIYKTLKALNFCGEAEIRETFKTVQMPSITIDAYKAQVLIINATYKIGINDEKNALNEMKEAMMICQNIRNKIGISQVYRLFSLVHFYNKDIRDAMDYISFAMEETERKKDYDEMTVVSYYAAAANFIYGNISKAQRLITQAEKAAVFSGRKEWALRCKFLSGRFCFEIGLYIEAYQIFDNLLQNWENDKNCPQNSFIANWLLRTKLFIMEKLKYINEKMDTTNLRDDSLEKEKEKYSSFIDGNIDVDEIVQFHDGDGSIFEIEAAYIQGNYKKAIDLSEVILALPFNKGFQFLEQPDWSSGFAQCEFLLYSMKDYWHRMVTVWWSLAVCHLGDSRALDAVHAMQQIIRDERMADIDPNAAFYFFANFKVLDKTNANEVDCNTAISMAFKRLQRRASKIDDIETRHTYLSSQYWNQIVFDKAREYKLL
ncbi:MAG: hypothetical protein Ta2B_18580 [Termitinemataceae bacterium]|nr:MAG: hypothetical protein Ta2B_18580 [Termitinemataceae bacterium]